MSSQVTHRGTENRAVRRLDDGWVSGVCAGLAAQLKIPVLLVRIAFVVLTSVKLIGLAFYLVFWLFMPPAQARASMGVLSAERAGMRTTAKTKQSVNYALAAALFLLGAGLLWATQISPIATPHQVLFPVLLAAPGLALIWWQADHAATTDRLEISGWRRLLGALRSHWTTIALLIVGLLLIGVGIWMGYQLRAPEWMFGISMDEPFLFFFLVLEAVVATVLICAPWLIRVRRERNTAIAERMVSDTRADIAAHLHDSVLQTLALIQRNAADPATVTALARRQERELRNYLYGEEETDTTLVAALTQAAADVEDRWQVEVELVNVGDTEMDDELADLVSAAKEAMRNAAKHSGERRVDVYIEVTDELVSVFVRDRGVGFDLGHIPPDRMGVRESIQERMNRAGGRAIIKTAPEQGTEVRLEISR
ncbi:MAG: PspC domain-containing protein [Propionibacteriaceae bacterium]|nr:PspC domain-containing protein [Propionibacteriaceae bacterium]